MNAPNSEFGDAQNIALESRSRDVVTSALALNFVPDRAKALDEMSRVTRPGGILSFYVWDYPGGGQEFVRAFWTAATALDPRAADLTEDKRFPYCTRDGLLAQMADVKLPQAECAAISIPTVFRDFDDFWHPFTLGTGPAPGYCSSLSVEARAALKGKLSDTLVRHDDGSIHLNARAWAVKARV